MAWTAPATWVSGAILTAAQLNTQLRDNMLAGGPIYTNEAARDAAITSPFEGQRAYLTAPTVPDAAGGATYKPTGVQTIYNGTVWVCVTPVGSFTTTSATTTSTSYTTSLSTGTTPTATLVTGTTALVHIAATYNTSSSNSTYLSVSVSGAGTVAASDDYATLSASTSNFSWALSFIISGLTAGTNTFSLSHKTGGGTATYQNRRITVQGIA